MGSRREDREQDFGTVSRDPAQGQAVQRSGRLAATLAVLGAPLAVAVEIVTIPGWRLIRAAQVVGFELGAAEDRLSTSRARQQRAQLLADALGVGLQRFSPRKQVPLEIVCLGNTGKMEEGWPATGVRHRQRL